MMSLEAATESLAAARANVAHLAERIRKTTDDLDGARKRLTRLRAERSTPGSNTLEIVDAIEETSTTVANLEKKLSSYESLRVEMDRAVERAVHDHRQAVRESLRPSAESALRESLASFAVWCKQHRSALEVAHAAGIELAGSSRAAQWPGVMRDNGIWPESFGMRIEWQKK